jgi:DNA (cytosine-5)-methyltransferase 1
MNGLSQNQTTKPKLKIKGVKPKKLIIKTHTQLKFIDLFCGIGGFHQALSKLDAKCILACDIDKFCREVYTNNYAITPCEDVKKIDPLELEDFDIICGGFPCQAFSNAGKKKTFEDDRGLLFDEIIRIAKHKKPKFMFLENVKHILKVGDGEVIKYIKEKLDTINYNVQIFNMSPHEYGVPQQRERVYFVCVRKDIYKSPVELLTPKTNQIVFKDYLNKKEDIDESYFLNGDLLECLNAWDEMIQVFEVDEKISPTIMVNEFYKTYTKEEFKALATWRQDYITKNKPLYEKYKDQWDAWYEKHKVILSKREIYAKLEWQVGKIKPNDSIFNYFIQFRQSGIRVKKAHYFPTLVAISQIPIYGKEKRYITPKECLRLQSFPDDFKLLEGDRHAYKQLGNCVNVSNVSNVIESTLKLYNLI